MTAYQHILFYTISIIKYFDCTYLPKKTVRKIDTLVLEAGTI